MIKKKIKYLIFLGTLILINSYVFGQWIVDKDYGFKINVPSGWTQNSSMDGTDKVYDFLSPDENAAVQLRAFKAIDKFTLDLLVQVYEESMLPQGAIRESLTHHISKQGIQGKQGIYTLNYNGTPIAMGVFFAIENGIGYVISAIIPSAMLEDKTTQVKRVTESFTLLENKTQMGRSGLGGLTGRSSNFQITKIKLCDKLDYNNKAVNPKNTFGTRTPEIHAVINFTGRTSKDLTVSWVYTNWNRTITEDAYNFTDSDGVGVVSLSKPNNGWPVGSYKIIFKLDGNLIDTKTFEVIDNNSVNGLSGLSGGNTGSSKNYVSISGSSMNGIYKFSSSGSYPIKNKQTVVVRGLDANGRNALEIYLYNQKGTGTFKYGPPQGGSPRFVIGAVDGKAVSSDSYSGSGELIITEYREGGMIVGTFSAKMNDNDIKGSFSLKLSTPKMPGGY